MAYNIKSIFILFKVVELSKKKRTTQRECSLSDNPIIGVLKINIRKLLSKSKFEKLAPDFPQLPLPCYLQTELSVSFCFSLALQMTSMPSFQLAFPPPEPLANVCSRFILSRCFSWFRLRVGGSRFTDSLADCPVVSCLVWIPVALCILWRCSLQHSTDAGAARRVQYSRLERCSVVEGTRALAGPEFGISTHIVFEDSLLSDKERELESWLKSFQECN